VVCKITYGIQNGIVAKQNKNTIALSLQLPKSNGKIANNPQVII
jgi:hypothetical protein